MADFRALSRQHPAIRAYIRHRRWVDRSGVLAYAPNTAGGAFSTDAFGFRRGELEGTPYDLGVAFSGRPYALVLGSSHVFGFGLPSDADTIPSHLSAQNGFACINLSFPEAQLQALYAVALRICMQAPRPPAFIALLPGGMLTSFAYVRACDPLFGVPNFQNGAAPENGPDSSAEKAAFAALMTYTTFWIAEVAALAHRQGCPFILHPEYTAFEKPALSVAEVACGVTVPQSTPDRLRFETHRLRYPAYTDGILGNLPIGVRVARCDPSALSYLDEFHYTAEATAQIATAITQAFRHYA
jgi:hypothetical protein